MIEVKKGPQRSEWLESPYTANVAKAAAAERRATLERLMGACNVSTDPAVLRAFERFTAAKDLHKLVTQKEIGKELEDDGNW